MAKIILNGCFGGYGWSIQGIAEVLKRKGANSIHVDSGFCPEVHGILNGEMVDVYNIDRENPVAIQVLEDMGSKFCSSNFSKLYIEEYNENDFIPSIDEYDGCESILYVEDGKICDEYDTWNPEDYPLPGPTEVKTRKYTVVIHAVYDLEADSSEEAIEQAMAELVNEDTDAFTVVERAD